MGFSKEVVEKAWTRAHDKVDEPLPLSEAHCEGDDCNNLIYKRRKDSTAQYGWEARQKMVGRGYTLSNCEIRCSSCCQIGKSF